MRRTTMKPPLMMGRYASDTYGEQCASEQLSDWGINGSAQRRTNTIHGRALTNNLLGRREGTILTIDTKEQADNVLQRIIKGTSIDLKPKSPSITDDDHIRIIRNANELAGNGMFIIMKANMSLGPVKQLIKLFNIMGWPYDDPAKDSNGEVDRIISKSNLTNDVKQRLIEHVGEQYDMLLPVISGITKLPADEQRGMTWEDVWVRLNPKPGTVPPWGSNRHDGLFDYIIKGDTTNAIAYYNRLIDSGTLVIQFAGWLANLITQYALMKVLVDSRVLDKDDAAHSVGLSAPSSRNNVDSFTGKRNGWVTDRNYRIIARRSIPIDALKHMARRTADDLTLIKKRGRKQAKDAYGNVAFDDAGKEITELVDKPQNESLPDEIVGLRMVLRASETFAGRMSQSD